jgi:hypothetical protein
VLKAAKNNNKNKLSQKYQRYVKAVCCAGIGYELVSAIHK